MRYSLFLASLCFLLNTTVAKSADISSDYSIAGAWKGTLEILGEEAPLIFSIEESPNGQASGHLVSPKHTMEKIPLSQISLKDREVKLYADLIKGSFVGRLSPKSKRIKGEWTQGGFTLPLDLEFNEAGFVVDRPQNPDQNPSYEVSNVRFLNKFGPHRIAGTFTAPKGAAPGSLPAVILISDSGAHDRDSSHYGHKPFWVLADYLTRKGVAVLRYDDRGVGESEGVFEEASHLDLATDAWAAVEFLSTRLEIDKSKIGIIGHGEGGMIAPIVASKRTDVAFIAMLAGPGVSGDQSLIAKSKALGGSLGLSPEFLDLHEKFSRALFDALSATVPDFQRIETLGKKFEDEAKKLKNISPEQLEGLEKALFADFAMFEKPWFHNYIKHDPGPTLELLKIPVLSINGELDRQIIPELHVPEIEAHLKAGGNSAVEIHTLKKHNHLLQRADSGTPAEYSKIEETISPQVLKLISEWLLKH